MFSSKRWNVPKRQVASGNTLLLVSDVEDAVRRLAYAQIQGKHFCVHGNGVGPRVW